jgi:hypothetical protein
MSKIDFKKELKHLYAPKKKFEIVEVPPMQFLSVDGTGDPGEQNPQYMNALGALYPMSYKLKFASKLQLGKDYVVPPLEGLWWAEDMNTAYVENNREEWIWRMLMMVPDWITQEMFEEARELVGKKDAPVALDKVKFGTFDEGLSVQIMHIGPYADEAPTIAKLHQEFIPENGLVETGHHHEIYLSDPRRVAPEKLRTVLRQPVRRQ